LLESGPEPEKVEGLKAPPKAEEPKSEPEKTEEPPKGENRIAVLMRARKQAQLVRESAESEAQARLKELQAKESELASREKAFATKLREKPLESLRELGLDPREFFERAIEDPKQLEPTTELQMQLQALNAKYEALQESLKQRDQENVERSRTAAQEQGKRVFVGEVFAAKDKFAHLNAVYEDRPQALAEEAVSVIREYVRRGGDPAEITNSEIAEWLEQQERERYNSIKSRLERAGSEATEPAGGNVSLTQKDASTKKSQRKKAVSEMTAEEARVEALRALEEAA